jgi:hypothetical protein
VNNTSYGIRRGGYGPAISNCIVWGNSEDLNGCSATYSWLTTDGDPCFVDGDEYFHINIHSPCVNAGNPSGSYSGEKDIDGDARLIGSYVDMGADEVIVPVAESHQWGLDEKSGTTAKDSVGTTNGTFNGNDPCWVRGNIGGAIDCNGVSDYFSISSPTLNPGNDYNSADTFTVAGWFETSQSTGIQTIVGSWMQYGWSQYGYNQYFGWQVLVENNKVVARFAAAVFSDITGTSDVVSDNKWHHFALVYPTYYENAVLYVDGQQQGTPGRHNIAIYVRKFRIGDGSYVLVGNPVLKGGPFCGKIDDVMIYNRTLSAEEVWQLFESGQ